MSFGAMDVLGFLTETKSEPPSLMEEECSVSTVKKNSDSPSLMEKER